MLHRIFALTFEFVRPLNYITDSPITYSVNTYKNCGVCEHIYSNLQFDLSWPLLDSFTVVPFLTSIHFSQTLRLTVTYARTCSRTDTRSRDFIFCVLSECWVVPSCIFYVFISCTELLMPHIDTYISRTAPVVIFSCWPGIRSLRLV